MQKRYLAVILVVVLFLALAVPVWADDGEGHLVLPGGSLVVGPGEDVNEDVVVAAGTLELRQGGRVRGDVVVFAGEATVNGTIEGNLVVVAGSLSLRSNAVIKGDLVTAASNVDRDPGAVVEGQVQDAFHWEMPIVPGRWSLFRRTNDGGLLRFVGSVVQWIMTNLALIVLGIALLQLLPQPTSVVRDAVVRGWLPSAGVGLLTLVALAIVLPLLVIICLGIPIAVVLGLAAAAAGLFGWVVVSIVLGQKMLSTLKLADPHFALAVVTGVLAVRLVSAVPCLGWLAALIVLCIGLGSVLLTRFGTIPYVPSSTAVAAPPSSPAPPSDSANA